MKILRDQTSAGLKRDSSEMLYTLAIIFLVLWLIGWLGLHLLGAAIHLLVVLAIVCFVLALVRRS